MLCYAIFTMVLHSQKFCFPENIFDSRIPAIAKNNFLNKGVNMKKIFHILIMAFFILPLVNCPSEKKADNTPLLLGRSTT